jgi:hypothetical protein
VVPCYVGKFEPLSNPVRRLAWTADWTNRAGAELSACVRVIFDRDLTVTGANNEERQIQEVGSKRRVSEPR